MLRWGWVWILSNEEEAKRFKVEAKMESMSMSMRWAAPVHSIRKPVSEIIDSGNVFITNSKEIRNPFLFKKSNENKSYWTTELIIHQIAVPLPTSAPYIQTNDPMKKYLSKPKDSWAYVREDKPFVIPDAPIPDKAPRPENNQIQPASNLESETTSLPLPNAEENRPDVQNIDPTKDATEVQKIIQPEELVVSQTNNEDNLKNASPSTKITTRVYKSTYEYTSAEPPKDPQVVPETAAEENTLPAEPSPEDETDDNKKDISQ